MGGGWGAGRRACPVGGWGRSGFSLLNTMPTCPAVFHWVELIQMAADYRKTHGKTPVIVVDGNNCLYIWVSKVEWLCGGQWDEYLKILQDFLSAFEKIGVKLVFFFDGQPPINKRKEWLSRRHQHIEKSKKVFTHVKNSLNMSVDMFTVPAALPYAMPIILKYVLQATVYCNVDGECDRTIASYAAKNECLAILAQDTDYIIYPTVPYVSIEHLDLKTMRTRMYCREALCRELSINLQMLPLFACLVGTDYISRENLASFNSRICAGRFIRGQPRIHTTVRCVAQYITNFAAVHVSRANAFIDDIYNSLGITHAISLVDFKKGLEIYTLDSGISGFIYPDSRYRAPQNEGIYDVLLRKVKNGELLPKILNVIFTGREICNPSLEDVNASNKMPPCVLVYRPIRQRMYCLMFELKDKYIDKGMFVPHTSALLPTSNTVEEWWVNPSRYDGKGSDVVSPESLNLSDGLSNATVMLDIITGNRNSSDLLNKKWKVFMACLKPTMTNLTFQNIPHQFKSLCAVLNYLIQQQDVSLQLWEVEVFLTQAVHPKFKDQAFHKQLKLQPYNPRAVHLATLFLRGAEAFFDLIWFCGNPIEIKFCMPWNFFNGIFFHWIYKCMSVGDATTVKLRGENKIMFQQLQAATLEGINLQTSFPK